MRKIISFLVLTAFVWSCIMPPAGLAQTLVGAGVLPEPGTMLPLSSVYVPAHLQGVTIDQKDPFKFDFLVRKGDAPMTDEEKSETYKELIKYFLASLTVPDENQWVNLSPYEGDRLINENFGMTGMGRELLAQDYLLKQLTASLIHPDTEIGKKFWQEVYRKAYDRYGTTDIPIDTFNKVWIIPDDAVVFEQGNTAYLLSQHLKVMTERDYVAMKQQAGQESPVQLRYTDASQEELASLSSEVMRDIVVPAIEKEINEGQTFAGLRQVCSAMILATWYKKALRETILGKLYADQGKVQGGDQDPRNNEEIYKRYVEAFQKGVFNLIREDVDTYSQEFIPRKYFSGGVRRATGDDPQKIQYVDSAEITGPIKRLMDRLKEFIGLGQYETVGVKVDQSGVKPVVDRRLTVLTQVEKDLLLRHYLGAISDALYVQKNARSKKEALAQFSEALNKDGQDWGDGERAVEEGWVVVNKANGEWRVTSSDNYFDLTFHNKYLFSELSGSASAFLRQYDLDTARVVFVATGGMENKSTKAEALKQFTDELEKHHSSLSRDPARLRLWISYQEVDGRVRVIPSQRWFEEKFNDPKDLLKGIDKNGRHEELSKEMLIAGVSHNPFDLPVHKYDVWSSSKNGRVEESDIVKVKLTHAKVRDMLQWISLDDQNFVLDHLKFTLDPFNDQVRVEVKPPEAVVAPTALTSVSVPVVDNPVSKPYGGIDLNASNLNLQVKRDGNGVPLPVTMQDLEGFKIDGLVPEILSIEPVMNLPVLSDALALIGPSR